MEKLLQMRRLLSSTPVMGMALQPTTLINSEHLWHAKIPKFMFVITQKSI